VTIREPCPVVLYFPDHSLLSPAQDQHGHSVPSTSAIAPRVASAASSAVGLNIYLQPVLVEIAWNAVRHDGYLKSLYHRHVTRNGGYRSSAAKNKAITTVAHAILVIIWNMLSTGRPYEDLGAAYFEHRTDPDREARRLIARLEALGKHVTVNDAA
jgi:hypothetical protein